MKKLSPLSNASMPDSNPKNVADRKVSPTDGKPVDPSLPPLQPLPKPQWTLPSSMPSGPPASPPSVSPHPQSPAQIPFHAPTIAGNSSRSENVLPTDTFSTTLPPLLIVPRKSARKSQNKKLMVQSRRLPSWLASLVLHLALLLILALLPIGQRGGSALSLILGESAEEGVEFALEGLDNLELNSPTEVLADSEVMAEQEISESKLEEIAELFQTDIQPLVLANEKSVSRMLSGRLAVNRSSLLASGGGSAETEAAVELGLQWLATNQLSSGGWSLRGNYSDGANQENQTGATAMALNAFLGAGYTHREGKYADRVEQGIQFLIHRQNSEGCFATGEPAHHQAYSQAMATITLLEAYGLTGDTELKGPAMRAIRYAEMAQSKLKGWRYEPRTDADVSVTGWFVMALATARMVGLEINDKKLQSVNDYLDSVASRDMSAYAYKERHGPDLTMTAEALLCRILLGWSKTTPGLQKGVEELVLNVPDQSAPIHSVYFWYYATQVLHHYGGDEWELWNAHMKKSLPNMQVMQGPETGSWGPERDMYGSVGGRLYTTCLNIYCLEVYYRHLAVYSVK